VVTVEQLLLDPAAHHQHQVRVVGFFRFGREHVAIYPSAREAFQRGKTRGESTRGIWLVSPESAGLGLAGLVALNRTTVGVSGTFINRSKAGAGHFGGWPAELRRITRIDAVVS
jgi:hypothetical protein